MFRKLKERLGFDRVKIGFSGAAPISHNILKYFQSIGIPIREGYGMTETTGITHMSDERYFKLGTVGKPLPDTDVRIAEDGEILVRHKGIFKGYFKDEETTREALHDGWMHTGDVGEVDAEGYLKITDRKKDLIITAGGKNIAPQYIENLLKFSPYINDAVVIGDNRKFISAIIVIDEENVVKFAQDQKVQFTTFASLTRSEEVLQLIQEEVEQGERPARPCGEHPQVQDPRQEALYRGRRSDSDDEGEAQVHQHPLPGPDRIHIQGLKKRPTDL